MFKKLQDLLEANKISKEVADELDVEISGELKKLRDESAGYRTKYQDLNKNFESISKTKEELETKLSNFDGLIQKAKDEGKGELVKELETQKAQTQKLQSNLEAISKENIALKIQSGIDTALSKFEVIDKDLVSSYIKGFVELSDDNLKFKKGGDLVNIDDGLKSFFEDKPQLLKPKGNSGSGASGQSIGGYKDDTLTAQMLSKINKG